MAILSFRSGNYDRLEGGIGRNRVGGMKRFGWKKFAVVLVGVVWLFGPRAHTFSQWGNGNDDFGKFHCLSF
jgi:guanosine-diphosphatase